MTSMMNLEDMPQLVLENITSFLNLKELLTLEQVSRKMKLTVDAHFLISDNLIVGHLPEVGWQWFGSDEEMAKNKRCLDGFLKVIKRCGMRLRTIYVFYRILNDSTSISNYKIYLKHIFASAEMSEKCPNVENIIAFPKMDSFLTLAFNLFYQQKILLQIATTEIYANKIKLSMGETCKLRSISLLTRSQLSRDASHEKEHLYTRMLNDYSNIEQIAVYDDYKNFLEVLPQFIKNGLKDLQIHGDIHIEHEIYYEMAKKFCEIGKDLRTLRITTIFLESVGDIVSLNKLPLPKNSELGITVELDNCFGQLSENVCNSIVKCDIFETTDYSSMSKLKNLKTVNIDDLLKLKAIAEGSFPQLKEITNKSKLCEIGKICDLHHNHLCSSCNIPNTCDVQICLPQLLINKGNQLMYIDISMVCRCSVDVTWKAFKHCRAAKMIAVDAFVVDSQLNVTYDDVEAIFHLPHLQAFTFGIIPEEGVVEDDTCKLLPELIERTITEYTDFQFKYDASKQKYSLKRIY